MSVIRNEIVCEYATRLGLEPDYVMHMIETVNERPVDRSPEEVRRSVDRAIGTYADMIQLEDPRESERLRQLLLPPSPPLSVWIVAALSLFVLIMFFVYP